MSAREAAQLLGPCVVVYAVALAHTTIAPDPTDTRSPSAAASFGSLPIAAASGPRNGTQLCSFSLANDGTWRCLPDGADADTFFADADCTQRLADVPKGCAAPAYAISSNFSSCDWQSSKRVFSVGRPYTGPLTYRTAGGACSPFTTQDLTFYDLYSIGEEVPSSFFPRATLQTEP